DVLETIDEYKSLFNEHPRPWSNDIRIELGTLLQLLQEHNESMLRCLNKWEDIAKKIKDPYQKKAEYKLFDSWRDDDERCQHHLNTATTEIDVVSNPTFPIQNFRINSVEKDTTVTDVFLIAKTTKPCLTKESNEHEHVTRGITKEKSDGSHFGSNQFHTVKNDTDQPNLVKVQEEKVEMSVAEITSTKIQHNFIFAKPQSALTTETADFDINVHSKDYKLNENHGSMVSSTFCGGEWLAEQTGELWLWENYCTEDNPSQSVTDRDKIKFQLIPTTKHSKLWKDKPPERIRILIVQYPK
uniref:Uncharacterized protein n=1 Tax=Panagrolaimus sp. ES5 TaxID=591445 RepID=A0AC34GE21_9BILA